MTSGALAALVAGLAWAFIEGFGRFYPPHDVWWRMRRIRGRDGVRKARERTEKLAREGPSFRLALLVFGLCIVWVAAASLLDKRWYEVLWDVLPSVFIGVALIRTGPVLAAVAARMKRYEEQAGDDPDAGEPDGTVPAVAL